MDQEQSKLANFESHWQIILENRNVFVNLVVTRTLQECCGPCFDDAIRYLGRER
jgi:hypothetical protein